MKNIVVGLIALIFLSADYAIPQASSETNHQKIKVRVRVSNQSFAVSPVDIKTLIDDKIIVDEDFLVGDQHNVEIFWVQLSEGNHKISISSKKGQSTLEKDFNVTSKQRWIDVSYWYYPKSYGDPMPRQLYFQIVEENRLID